MVVLDEERVREVPAMRSPSAVNDRRLLEVPQTGQGLPGRPHLERAGTSPGGPDGPRRRAGHAARVHQHVQGRALGGEDPSRVAAHAKDDVAATYRGSVCPGRHDTEAKRAGDRPRDGDPREDAARLGHDPAFGRDAPGQERARRSVPVGAVLGEGPSSEVGRRRGPAAAALSATRHRRTAPWRRARS